MERKAASGGQGGRRLFTKAERGRILSKTGGRCAHCGKGLTVNSMTVDHVFPVDKGGLNDEYNLLPLCHDCNNEKSNYVYNFTDYYRCVLPGEEELFRKYNNYATFDYTRSSILGYDEVLFWSVSPANRRILASMAARGASRRKLEAMQEKLFSKMPLRRAYPADAEKIYSLIEYGREKYGAPCSLYKDAFDVYLDTRDGEAYIMEQGGRACGAFIYRPVSRIPEDVMVPQLRNIADEFGLEVRHVMTCALTTRFAAQFFDCAMNYLDESQLGSGALPVYTGILGRAYRDRKDCIIMPFTLNGESADLEFMPAAHLKKLEAERCRDVFSREGYRDAPDADIARFAELTIRHARQSDLEGEPLAEGFFEKYPGLLDYFKPDSYEHYGTGFGAPSRGAAEGGTA